MSQFDEMRRVLHGHCWKSAEDWASNIYRLAELTDNEIDRLAGRPRSFRSRAPAARGPSKRSRHKAPIKPHT